MRAKKYVFTALCLALLCPGAVGIASAAELQTHKNSIDMEFVLIPAGSFMMGTDPAFEEGGANETPRHSVTISEPFYLGKYEVTQAEWEAVMGDNPSKFKDPNNPVECVSWNNVQVFISKLNQKEGHNRYRLPTEAEWEYAARAGTSGAYSFSDDKIRLSWYAWYGEDFYTGSAHPVGVKRPNPWGLYDVHGNVYEWVQDLYEDKYYASSPGIDPKGAAKGPDHVYVYRGGGWYGNAGYCRSGFRGYESYNFRIGYLGFRLALSTE